jgi:branched-chain amino acid transport system permease protein
LIIVIHHIKYGQAFSTAVIGRPASTERGRRNFSVAPRLWQCRFEGERPALNSTIMLFLMQDGITNGAIYALLGLALVLVFAVTRVILIPQGEFVTYGALTYASLASGQFPGTARLAVAMGVVAFGLDIFAGRKALHGRLVARAVLVNLVLPGAIYALTSWFSVRQGGIAINIALSLLIVAVIGLFLYRVAFQPIAHTSVLVLLIASVGCHLAMQGFGLVFFGAEGQRGPPISNEAFTLGALRFTGQSIAVYAVTIAFIVALWLFFDFTLTGKALRATAVNRLGARLVGIRTTLAGQIAFLMAALIGALSGILIVPITTLYYDTGFLIGLKGFIAAIIGGLVSYPLTAIAALVVGIVEAFSSFYASDYKEVIVFFLILPVLVLRSLSVPAVEEEKD